MTSSDDELWSEILDPAHRPPSVMMAALPAGRDASVTELGHRLERHGYQVVEQEILPEPDLPAAQWQMRVKLDLDEDDALDQEVDLFLAPTESLSEVHLELSPLTQEDVAALGESRYSVGVATRLRERPLAAFHAQARLLHALVPDAVAVLDVAAAWSRAGRWLRDVAGAKTPPSSSQLFSVHVVSGQDDDACWLHTHGLVRCGSVELEVFDVPRDKVGVMGQLLNAVAALFIEEGPPPPDTPFVPGQGMELIWLPWPAAVKALRPRCGGGLDDRDEVHGLATGVLAVPQKKKWGLFGSRWGSPNRYLPLLDGEPLLYVSTEETLRRASLAAERLPRFRQLFARFGANEEWVFLVKLGYATDGAEGPADREHIWFQVHGLSAPEEGLVDATCLNQPYEVSALHEGQRGEHDLSLLSDWTVLCRLGRFDADNVQHLQALLSEESASDADGPAET